jgi:hypothetical protein
MICQEPSKFKRFLAFDDGDPPWTPSAVEAIRMAPQKPVGGPRRSSFGQPRPSVM